MKPIEEHVWRLTLRDGAKIECLDPCPTPETVQPGEKLCACQWLEPFDDVESLETEFNLRLSARWEGGIPDGPWGPAEAGSLYLTATSVELVNDEPEERPGPRDVQELTPEGYV